ncbi:MAG: protease pro-enzyme activation domain-containing protein [Ktedonobacterales bacterium]
MSRKLVALLLLALLVAALPAASPRAVAQFPGQRKLVQAPNSPLSPGQTITVSLVLRGRAPGDLQRFLGLVNDPASGEYHRYLSPIEIAARFGVSAQDRARVDGVLRAAGLPMPAYSADGLLANLEISVAKVQEFFDIKLNRYRAASGRLYYAADRQPRIPADLDGAVVGVLGLDQRNVLSDDAELAHRDGLATGVTGLGPSDIARAYDLGPLQQSGLDGSNQTIALAEIGAFNQSDIQAYDQKYNINASAPQVIPVGSGPSTTTAEPTLDIELVHAIAPHARILVYESAEDLLSVAQMLSQIVSDDQAQVLSISLGTCEAELDPSVATAFLTSLDDSFTRADAEGMSVLVASGDYGAYGCQDSQLSVDAVAASPFVTSVGGTTLFLHSDGMYNYEAGWEGPLEEVGSGGGLSTLYQRPDWQTGPGVQNVYSDGMRQVPDVSADADPLTGYAVYYSDGGCSSLCWQIVGGTSAATPVWASLVLLINQMVEQHGLHPLGFLDQELYQLGAGAGNGSVTAPLPFHDVTIGGNLYYDAAPGWDYCTGWGSPDGAVLAQDLLQLE